MADMSFKEMRLMSVARILVSIDLRKGLRGEFMIQAPKGTST